nr:lactate racemase domain-containing protein [Saliphagus infecundisoli]
MTEIPFSVPDAEELRAATDATIGDLPRVAPATRHRDHDELPDVERAAHEAVGDIDGLGELPPGSEVGITAGSRGIDDMPTILETAVSELRERDLKPVILAAMGSHGGATAEGQRETLAALGITPETIGCVIRSSMAVDRVGEDGLGRPVYAARDAREVDGVVLANRVKPHTDFSGPVESGLCKMAVIGLGKHRGAESLHNAGLAADFSSVIQERAGILLEELPIIGGIALVENARHRAAHVEGIDAGRILEREPELLETARETLATLPVTDLDLLVVDEIGKEISGTGMDTNVLGRTYFHGEDEPDEPSIARVYARSVTPASHGNALGMGLADFVHRDVVADLAVEDMYVNVVTSGEPRRAKLPFVVPDDATALLVAPSTTGVADPGELRFARIRNTLEPDDLVVSEPVARELEDRPDVTVGKLRPIEFSEGRLETAPYD